MNHYVNIFFLNSQSVQKMLIREQILGVRTSTYWIFRFKEFVFPFYYGLMIEFRIRNFSDGRLHRSVVLFAVRKRSEVHVFESESLRKENQD